MISPTVSIKKILDEAEAADDPLQELSRQNKYEDAIAVILANQEIDSHPKLMRAIALKVLGKYTVTETDLKIIRVFHAHHVTDPLYPLHAALDARNYALAEELIGLGEDVARLNTEGKTPLDILMSDYQSLNQTLKIYQLLMGKISNVAPSKLNAYLVNAIKYGWVPIVKDLIQRGAEIDAVSENFTLPLQGNINYENFSSEYAKLFDALYGEKLPYALFTSWYRCQIVYSFHELERFLDALMQHPDFAKKNPNMTARYLAQALSGAFPPEKLEQWLSAFDFLIKGPQVYELIRSAIEGGNVNALQILISRGAPVNKGYEPPLRHSQLWDVDIKGLSPLHHALLVNNREIVRLLLKAGVPPNLPDRQGRTPLQMLFQKHKEFPDVLGWWLEHCSDWREQLALPLQTLNWQELAQGQSWPLLWQLVEKGVPIPSQYLSGVFNSAVEAMQFHLVEWILNRHPGQMTNLINKDAIACLLTPQFALWGCSILERFQASGIDLPALVPPLQNPVNQMVQARNYLAAARLINMGFRATIDHPALAGIEKMARKIKEGSPETSELLKQLSMRNIGHFIGDAFLEEMKDDNGERLEGSLGSISVNFLLAIFRSSRKADPRIAEVIELLQGYVEVCKEIEAALTLKNDAQRAAALGNIQRQQERKIKNLPPGKALLLPWGWSSSPSGHGMALLCEKLTPSDCAFHIFNTGMGTEAFHPTQHDRAKLYADTLVSKKIPVEDVIEHEFLKSMVEPKVLGVNKEADRHRVYQAADLYLLVEAYENYEGQSRFLTNVWMKAQLSGTCTMRCLMAFAAYYLGQEAYKEFRRETKESIVRSIVDIYGELISQSPALYKILNLAFPDLFGHVVKELEGRNPDLHKTAEKLERLEKLQKVLAGHAVLPPSRNTPPPVAASFPNVTGSVHAALQKLHAEKEERVAETRRQGFLPTDLPRIIPGNIQTPRQFLEALKAYKHYAAACSDARINPSPYLMQFLLESGRHLIRNADFKRQLIEEYRKGEFAELIENLLEVSKLLFDAPLVNHDKDGTRYYALQYAKALGWLAATALEEAKNVDPKVRIANWGLDRYQFNKVLYFYNHQTYLSPHQQQDFYRLLQFFKENGQQDKSRGSFYRFNNLISGDPDRVAVLQYSKGTGEYQWALEYAKSITDWKECDKAYEEKMKEFSQPKETEELKESWRVNWVLMQLLPNYLRQLRMLSLLVDFEVPSSKERTFSSKDIAFGGPFLGCYGDKRQMNLEVFPAFSVERDKAWGPVAQALSNPEEKIALPVKDNYPQDKGSLNRLEEEDSPPHNAITLNPVEDNHYLLQFRPHLHELLGIAVADPNLGKTTLSLLHLMDYFEAHLQELTQQDRRIFFARHLFRPLVLGEALRSPAERRIVMEELIQFMKTACRYFEDELAMPENRERNLEALCFLLEQQQRVFQWLKLHPDIQIPELERLMEAARSNIAELLHHPDIQAKPPLQHQLHLSLIDSFHFNESLTQEQVQMLLNSLFAVGKIHAEKQDNRQLFPHFSSIALSVMIEKKEEIRKALENNPAWARGILSKQLTLYAITVDPSLRWKFEGFPICSLQADAETTYQLNLATGEALKNGKEMAMIPDSFLGSLSYQEVFGRQRIVGVEHQDYVEVEDRGRLRINVDSASHWGGKMVKSIEHLIDGEWYEFVYSENPFYKALPPLPNLHGLQAWKSAQPGQNSAIVLDAKTRKPLYQIHADGTFSFPYGSKTRYAWVQTKDNPQFQDLCKFDPNAIVWQKIEGPGAPFLMQFPYYVDEQGRMLEFELDKGRWAVKGNPKVFISPNQTLVGFPGLTRYVVLENTDGEREAIFPVMGHSSMARGYVNTSKSISECIRVKLENNIPTARQPTKTLYLAYLALVNAKGPEDYRLAIDYLKKSHRFESYSPFEVRLLQAIFHSQTETQDHTVQADAVRIYAAWVLEDNQKRNPVPRAFPAERQGTTSDASSWKPQPIKTEEIVKASQHYYSRRNNLQQGLRLEDILDLHSIHEWEASLQAAQYRGISLAGAPFQLKEKPKLENYKALQPYSPSMAHEPMIRMKPGPALAESFLPLYALARSPDPQVRARLQRKLREMLHDTYPGNAALRTILEAGLVVSDPSRYDKDTLAKARKVIELADNVIKKAKEPALAEFNKALEDFYNSASRAVGVRAKAQAGAVRPKVKLFPDEPPVILPDKPPSEVLLRYAPSIKPLEPIYQLYDQFMEETTIPQEQIKYQPFEYDTDDEYFKKSVEDFNEDYKEGCRLNQNIPTYALKSKADLKALDKKIEALDERHKEDEKKLAQMEESILNRVNKLPEKDKEALSARAKIAAERKARLTMAECTALFLQASEEGFKRLTHLSDPREIANLYNDIGDFLVLRHALNHESKVLKLLKEFVKPETQASPLKNEKLQILGELMNKKRHIDFQKDPSALLVFEAELDVFYHEHQVRGLRSMTPDPKDPERMFPSIVLQRTQAAGKTFAFRHTMALLMADGYHCSIHIPPASQYETSLYDMHHISNRVFGQKERTMTFDDHPNHFTVEYLTYMKQTLERTIVNRDYLTLNEDTVGALECKYKKVRSKIDKMLEANQGQENEKIAALEKKAQLLKQILALIRRRAIFSVDEFHHATRPHTSLNMPVGKKEHIDSEEAEMVCAILKLAALAKKGAKPLLTFERKEKILRGEADFDELRSQVASELLQTDIWKSQLGKHLNDKEIPVVIEYILGKNPEVPDCIERLNDKQKELVVLAKCLLSEGWLKEALKKMVFQEHGLTEAPGKPKISVPFVANMKEAENSEFSDVYVTEVFTLIAYFVSGLAPDQIEWLIEDQRTAAYAERIKRRRENPSFTIQETEAAKRFKQATGMDLFQVKKQDQETLQAIALKLMEKNDAALSLTTRCILKNVFPQVELFAFQITSNGQNKMSMPVRIIGWTGSFDNPNMVPVGVDKEVEFGTNGRTVDLFVRQNDDVWVVNKGLEALMDEVWAKHPHKDDICGIVDVGCHYRGYTTMEVGKMLCRKLKETRFPGVLLFDKTGKLFFMPKDNPDNLVPVSGTTPKAIKDDTGYDFDELFYYYDHDHFTGTDFVLPEKARLILTCGENNRLFETIQGGRRERLLQLMQRLVFAVDSDSLPAMASKLKKPSIAETPLGHAAPDQLSVRHVLLYTHLVDAEKRREENFVFCTQKVENLIHRDMMDRLYALPVEEERRLFKQTSYLFVKDILPKLFAEFAREKKTETMEKYLQAYLTRLMAPLIGVITPKEWVELYGQCHDVIQKALPTLHATIKVPPALARETAQIRYTEQKHVQTNVQANVNVNVNQNVNVETLFNQNELRDKTYKEPLSVIKWKEGDFANPSFCVDIATFNLQSPSLQEGRNEIAVWRLDEALRQGQLGDKYPKLRFHPNILVTSNFAACVEGDIDLIGSFRKYPHELLLICDEVDGKRVWKLLICAKEEADFFKGKLASGFPLPAGRQMWLIRPNGRLALEKGSQPFDPAAVPEVREMLAQVQLFGGYLHLMTQQIWIRQLGEWLRSSQAQSDIKDFLEKEVKPLGYAGSAVQEALAGPLK